MVDGGAEVEWCSSTTLTLMILGGMELRGIKDGRGLLDACRMVELFGVMVASMVGLSRSMRGLLLKMGSCKMAEVTLMLWVC